MDDQSRDGESGPAGGEAGPIRSERAGFSAFRELVNQSPEGIMVHRGGRILYLNRSGARLLGYSDAASLIGKEVAAVVAPDAPRPAAEPGTPFEESYLTRDGVILPVEVVSSTATSGEVPFKFDFFRDISARKRMVDTLQRQKLHFEELFQNSPEAIVLFISDRLLIGEMVASSAVTNWKNRDGGRLATWKISRAPIHAIATATMMIASSLSGLAAAETRRRRTNAPK